MRNESDLMKRHAQRLGMVVVLAWLLGGVALSVRLTFGFILTLALGQLVVISLSGAVQYVRRD